jgi:hypothetical protein
MAGAIGAQAIAATATHPQVDRLNLRMASPLQRLNNPTMFSTLRAFALKRNGTVSLQRANCR